MLKIALPNKGSLSEGAVQVVKEAGYRCRRYGRELMVRDSENKIEFVFLRPRDISVYVHNGVLDMGITGRDLAIDSEADVVELLPLRFGKSDFYYAVPHSSSLTPEMFHQLRIATSYPNLVLNDLKHRNVTPARIIRLEGAVEIAIQLGVADVVADVVQSGKTLEDAGLKVIGEPLLSSEAVLIARQQEICQRHDVKVFIERLKGIVVAREYVIVEYDAPESLLETVSRMTPGIESPTVSPLSKKGWVAVKAMTMRKDVNRIMDELKDAGARGIIVTDIRCCRL